MLQPIEPDFVKHATLIIPGLLWVVGILGTLLVSFVGLVATLIWKRLVRSESKLDNALTYLYAVCLKLHPEGVDCDEIRKSLCSMP